MSSILDQIIAQKQQEISALYARHDIATLRRAAPPCRRNFYQALAGARAAGEPFFIAEFKRKSPSEGWINREAAVADQVIRYRLAGAHAVSVLTDGAFFGGSYDDLRAAAEALAHTSCLLLQKDFVLDPIQIYLARAAG
ncbi:MAG TPA: indole-3-glycerol-phosphate synthase TrpC, partial [Saprospiraceae bacterium]|nr:indole-3-glycerol-phosphate synthase TrpC [Saprospiraceae bacterium]